MKQSEIKTECEFAKDQIKMLQDKFERLRSICKHKNKHKSNHSYRGNSIVPKTICSDCGEVIYKWEKLGETNKENV